MPDPDRHRDVRFSATSSAGSSRRELSIPLRVNLVLSPKLSLQLYTQALLSAGDYPAIKELAAPRTYDFPVYGRGRGHVGLASRAASPT